jgi:hypothetical protein
MYIQSDTSFSRSSLLRSFKSRSSSGPNSQAESVRFRCVLQALFAHLPFS